MTASPLGIFVTILVLGILITIHEGGHFLAAKSIKIPVRQFAIGFGPRIVGFQWGETEVKLNWLPLGGYCAFLDDEQGAEEGVDPALLLRNRPIYQRAWVMIAGVLFNYVTAWLVIWMTFMTAGVPTGVESVALGRLMPNSPAVAAGLQPGDRVLGVANHPVKTFQEFKGQIGSYKAKPTTIEVQRAGKDLILPVTPNDKGLIGVEIKAEALRGPAGNPIVAGAKAWNEEFRITGMLWNALGMFVSQPKQAVSQTGGMITIVATGDQIFQHDPTKLFDLAVFISIELAIINILPLPALDGGHLLMLLIEKLRGRPLPRRIEEAILMFGFALIMGLGLLLIFKDILTVPGMYHH